MKEMIKNALILLIITIVSGALLGFVYENTKDEITYREQEDKKAAYKEVFNDASDFKAVDDFSPELVKEKLLQNGFDAVDINEIIEAKSKDGELLGYVFNVTSHEGYGGDIVFTMGIRNDGTLNGISFLSISETAGLGMEAEKVLKPQFVNRKVESFVYSKTGAVADNEVDAISGATITTNAITNAVNAGLYYFNKNYGGADNE